MASIENQEALDYIYDSLRCKFKPSELDKAKEFIECKRILQEAIDELQQYKEHYVCALLPELRGREMKGLTALKNIKYYVFFWIKRYGVKIDGTRVIESINNLADELEIKDKSLYRMAEIANMQFVGRNYINDFICNKHGAEYCANTKSCQQCLVDHVLDEVENANKRT